MFGGTAHGESPARTHAINPAEREESSLRSWIVVLLPVITAVPVGLALATQTGMRMSDETLMVARHVLLATGAAVCFGAGLVQLATRRIRHESWLAHRGIALTTTGLLVALVTQVLPGWPAQHLVTRSALVTGVAAAVIWAMAAALVLSASLSAFLEAASNEEDRLSKAELALRAAAETAISHQQEQRDLRHDARSALCALRVATHTLAQVGDRLDEETRGSLRRAVLEEVGHLDDLISRKTATHMNDLGVAKERPTVGRVPVQRAATDSRTAVRA